MREQWFRTVANDTPAYLWMSSPTDEDVFINKPFADFLGMDAGLIQWNRTNYVHPEDEERSRARFLECQARRCEYAVEFRIRRSDGQYRWGGQPGLAQVLIKEEFLGYAGSLLDITDGKQAEEQLRTTNAALAEELEERTRTENEIQALSARLINAQEEERARFARELHDGLSQQIAALSIATSNLKTDIPEEQAGARRAIGCSRSWPAWPKAFGGFRTSSIRPCWSMRGWRRHYGVIVPSSPRRRESGWRWKWKGSSGGVPSAVSLCIYRIVQEALQNVAKHAGVTEASVQLRRAPGVAIPTIADRGAGIAPGRTGAAAGLGLVSIKERTRLINGTVHIQSMPNRGTTITVTIPTANWTAACA